MNRENLKNDIELGLSINQLSIKYKKCQTTICYWLKKFNLKTIYKKGENLNVINFKKNGSVYAKLDWIKFQKLYDSGLNTPKLKSIGYSQGAINWAIENKKISPLRTVGESCKISHKLGNVSYDVFRTDEFRKKQSKWGGYKDNACGKCAWFPHTNKWGESCKLQGTWELKVAMFFDENNIRWNKNLIGYKYIHQNKERLYFPDFFLKEYNLYIEVKGYETDKDISKWSQFSFKLEIIKKNEIKDLKKWWKNRITKIQ